MHTRMFDNGNLPGVWLWIRRVVIFGLGIWVIVDAMLAKTVPIPELIIGLILIGVLPLDDLGAWLQRRAPRGHKEKDD